jgi:hypothetical protein
MDAELLSSKMTDQERAMTQRHIASILDYPSVYMGGPSRHSMDRALDIIKWLERCKRLVPTTCTHAGWANYRHHGTYCPDCGTDLHKNQE